MNSETKHPKEEDELLMSSVFSFIDGYLDEGVKCKGKEAKKDLYQYKCQSCGKTFSRQRKLKYHVEAVHEKIIDFQCKLCEYKSYYKANVQRHTRRVHPSEDVLAKIKSRRLSKEKTKEKEEYRCEDCDKTFPRQVLLKYHGEAVHEQIVKFSCKLCEQKSYYKNNMRLHLKRSHPSADVLTNIEPVVKSEPVPAEEIINCLQCDFTASDVKQVRRHTERVHLKIMRYQCSYCDFKTYFRSKCRDHMKKLHSKKKRKLISLECVDCKDEVDHSEHKYTHSNEHQEKEVKQNKIGEYKCEQKGCSYSTSVRGLLAKHKEEIHDKIKRFACSSCDYKSLFAGNVKAHIKYRKLKDHETARLLMIGCEDCIRNVEHVHRQFFKSDCQDCRENKEHFHAKRSSGGEFKCHSCSYSMTTKKALNKHIENVHLQLNKFACSLCEFKSYYKHLVDYHQNRKHKNDTKKVLVIGCFDCENDVDHVHTNQFKCDKCDFAARRHRTLKDHEQEVHLEIKRYACSLCDFKNFKRSSVLKHVQSNHHEEAKILDIEVHDYQEIVDESKMKTRSNTYSCDECDEGPFVNQKTKLAHYKEKHPNMKMFKCELCDHRDNYKQNLTIHMNNKHLKTVYHCKYCPYKSNWSTAFNRHMRTFHGLYKRKHYLDNISLEKALLCDKCGFSTFSKRDYEKHQKMNINQQTCHIQTRRLSYRTMTTENVNPGKFKCNMCLFSSDVPAEVRSHVNEEHQQSNLRLREKVTNSNISVSQKLMFRCKKCEFQTDKAEDLRTHIASH